jgi:hypothetical protein
LERLIMTTAIKEMETLIRSWHEGSYTNDEFCEQLDMLVSRHTAKVAVTKHFPNGLKKYAITDKNGQLIAEYTGK